MHSGQLRRVVRSVAEIDALLLLLGVLNYFVAGPVIEHRLLYAVAVAGYGGLLVLLRFHPPLRENALLELRLAATGMIAFVTAVLALSWGGRGPLQNLYLLPVVTTALSLGWRETLLQIALVVAGRVLLDGLVDGAAVGSLPYALSALMETAPVLLVAALTRSLVTDIENVKAELENRSDRDDLTGLLNMQAFGRAMREEEARAAARGGHFVLLVVDIDGLKSINDRHGHEAGDRTLVAVAEVLRRSSRSVDTVARYGGDEFLVLLSGAGPDVAKVVINRIRHNLFATNVDLGGSLRRVEVTVGAAVAPTDGKYLRDLINAADRSIGETRANRRAPFGGPLQPDALAKYGDS